MSESAQRHRRAAAGRVARCAVLSASDSRTRETDRGGQLIVERLQAAGHEVAAYELVKDEPADIERQLRQWLADPTLQLIITTGGTGISRRDTTIEVVERLIERPLPGFGELFRMLSFEEIGSAAMLSRATGGLAGSAFLFALPGSTGAVLVALDRLLLPELPHLLWERGR